MCMCMLYVCMIGYRSAIFFESWYGYGKTKILYNETITQRISQLCLNFIVAYHFKFLVSTATNLITWYVWRRCEKTCCTWKRFLDILLRCTEGTSAFHFGSFVRWPKEPKWYFVWKTVKLLYKKHPTFVRRRCPAFKKILKSRKCPALSRILKKKHCYIFSMPTILFYARHFLSYARHVQRCPTWKFKLNLKLRRTKRRTVWRDGRISQSAHKSSPNQTTFWLGFWIEISDVVWIIGHN